VLKSEAVDILTTDEWAKLQTIHDRIAHIAVQGIDIKTDPLISKKIASLGLFTKADLDME
jgi:hypothetical protein